MLDDRTREAVIRLIELHHRKNTASVAAARATLVREGFYTEDGRLTPEYGGRPTRAPKAGARKPKP